MIYSRQNDELCLPGKLGGFNGGQVGVKRFILSGLIGFGCKAMNEPSIFRDTLAE